MADDSAISATGSGEIVLAHCRPFRLGAVEVRPATREMAGPNATEILEPRVMQVLVALAEARGEILSRDDLIARCWEGRAVSEDAINRAISKLRRLGEEVAHGAFRIDTITKVGYRLVAGEPAEPAPRAVGSGSEAKSSGFGRRAALAGGFAVAAGLAGWSLFGRSAFEPPRPAAQLYSRAAEIVRNGSPEQTAQAIGFLREAVTIAPDYADAWGLLAIAYRLQADYEPAQAQSLTSGRAEGAARRALGMDPNNVNALAANALAIDFFRRWQEAEAAVRAVLAIDGEQPDMRIRLFWLLASVGRTREAIETIGDVGGPFAMNPFVQYELVQALWSAGRLDEADRLADRGLSLWPRHYGIWFTRFWGYAYTGRAERALAMAADEGGRPPGIPAGDFEIISVSARALGSGSPADIDAAIAAHRRAAPQGFGYCANAIRVAAALGRTGDALAFADAYYFNRGFAVAPVLFTSQQGLYARPSARWTDFLFSPSCASLHRTAQFRRLTDEIGLGDYWRRSRVRPDIWA
jgi:DNA-binding winged helix-turn-helix (wHTH) protein/Flp pilus assembly protein TadD